MIFNILWQEKKGKVRRFRFLGRGRRLWQVAPSQPPHYIIGLASHLAGSWLVEPPSFHTPLPSHWLRAVSQARPQLSYWEPHFNRPPFVTENTKGLKICFSREGSVLGRCECRAEGLMRGWDKSGKRVKSPLSTSLLPKGAIHTHSQLQDCPSQFLLQFQLSLISTRHWQEPRVQPAIFVLWGQSF